MLLIDTATTCLQNNCLSIDFFLNINSSFPLIFLSVKWWDGFQSRRIWKRCALFLLPPLLSFADMLVNCNSYVNMQICKKNWKQQKKNKNVLLSKNWWRWLFFLSWQQQKMLLTRTTKILDKSFTCGWICNVSKPFSSLWLQFTKNKE